MAWYAYKEAIRKIPQSIVDSIEDFDDDCNYDGDWWTAAALYMDHLEAEVKRLQRGEFTTQEIATLPFPIKLRNDLRKAAHGR